MMSNSIGSGKRPPEFMAKDRLEDQGENQLVLQFFNLFARISYPELWSRHTRYLRRAVGAEFVEHAKLRFRI